MTQVFINIIGQNASGKTAIAQKLEKKFGLNRVSGDELRKFLYKNIRYFNDLDGSYPNSKFAELNPLVTHYRFELTWTLLRAHQSVIYDGSGTTRKVRDKYLNKIKADFPNVKTVLIWADIPEKELLERLAERDKTTQARWGQMYTDIKKDLFEPPGDKETDVILKYDQHNYEEIEQQIKELLA